MNRVHWTQIMVFLNCVVHNTALFLLTVRPELYYVFMNSWSQENPAVYICIAENCFNVIATQSKNDWNGPEIWPGFFHKSISFLPQKNQWKTHWSLLDETSFCSSHTLQTWHPLNISFSQYWKMCSQGRALANSRNLQAGSTRFFSQRTSSFPGMLSINYLKHGRKNVEIDGKYFKWKFLFLLKITFFRNQKSWKKSCAYTRYIWQWFEGS